MRTTLGKLFGAKRTWLLLNIVLLVITVGGLGAATWFGGQWFNGSRGGGVQTEPVDAARDGVTRFLTISPGNLDEDLESVSRIAHGDFAEEWEKGSKSLKESVLQTGASMKPEILKAGYLKGDSDSATVILIADARISYKNKIEDPKDKKGKDDKKSKKDKEKWDKNGDGVPDARNEHYRIKVEMALIGGTWKVAKLELAK